MMGGTVIVHGDAQNDMSKILHSGTVVVTVSLAIPPMAQRRRGVCANPPAFVG
jgi:formylmethanofuran dehydrogenase subunit C